MKWVSLVSHCTDDEIEEPRGQEFLPTHITSKGRNQDENPDLSDSRHQALECLSQG